MIYNIKLYKNNSVLVNKLGELISTQNFLEFSSNTFSNPKKIIHFKNQLIEIYKLCDILCSKILNSPVISKSRNFNYSVFSKIKTFLKLEEN